MMVMSRGIADTTRNPITSLTPTTAQQDPANVMWNMYLDGVKEDDKRIADAWKEGSTGILVFVSFNLLFLLFISMTSSKTGLFSAIVAAFIIEFYKTLSPNSGDQTVALLGQISKQLANSPNGTYSNTANQSSPPSASMIWVIAMWLISLVLSLASAFIATLLQEWARRYVEMPNVPSEPHYRARVRVFLFLGTKFYKMRLVVQMAFSLLHLSIFLFFAGLMIVFHTINKKVAIAVDVAVGLFVLAYIMLSILPCLDVRCPYRTPMSYILWYPLHIFLSFVALLFRRLGTQFQEALVRDGGLTMTPIDRILVDWLESREKAFRTHLRYIADGLGKSIINGAIKAQGGGDLKIVSKLFKLLAEGDKRKLRKFASIPRNRILELIPLINPGRIVFREPLLILLRSCAEHIRVAGLDKAVHKRILLVCLDSIHYIAKAPNIPDFNFVWTNFANIELMRALWDDNDSAIRITSRSICALLARKVVRKPLEEAQPWLCWLHDVTGEAPKAIHDADVVTRDRMNFKSFVYGVLSNQAGDLPIEDDASFRETLAILLDARYDAHFDTNFDTIISRNRLCEEVGWMQQSYPQGSREVVAKLRSIFPFLPAYPLLYHYAQG